MKNTFNHSAAVLTAAAVICIVLISCRAEEEITYSPVSKNHLGLGTVSRITIYDADQQKAERILAAVFQRIDEIDDTMSLYQSESEVNRINSMAGKGYAEISHDTYAVISLAKDIADKSGGSFDPTIGPLVSAWGIGRDNPRIPGEDELSRLLELVDYTLISLEGGTRASLGKEGMMLDLGGIAKGYAADEAKRIITEMGSSSALINLGGNILLVGSKLDRTPWRIGIQDPNSSRGRYTMIITLESGTIVTSGIYERFFFDNETRYHHILDTVTGYPADNGLESVTIVTENSAYADGLSTAAFVLGLGDGVDFIESIPDAEAAFITRDKTIHLTSGFSTEKYGFTLSDESYEIITNP